MILATLICLNRPTPIILYFQLYIVYMYLTVFHLYYVICRKLSINFIWNLRKKEKKTAGFYSEQQFTVAQFCNKLVEYCTGSVLGAIFLTAVDSKPDDAPPTIPELVHDFKHSGEEGFMKNLKENTTEHNTEHHTPVNSHTIVLFSFKKTVNILLVTDGKNKERILSNRRINERSKRNVGWYCTAEEFKCHKSQRNRHHWIHLEKLWHFLIDLNLSRSLEIPCFHVFPKFHIFSLAWCSRIREHLLHWRFFPTFNCFHTIMIQTISFSMHPVWLTEEQWPTWRMSSIIVHSRRMQSRTFSMCGNCTRYKAR